MVSATHKFCRGCGVTKPASEFGTYRKRGKLYLKSRCRPCNNTHQNSLRNPQGNPNPKHPRHPPRWDSGLGVYVKKCMGCLVEKPLNDFNKRYGSPRPYCRICQRADDKARHAAEPEKRRARAKKSAERHAEAVRKRRAKWYAANRGRLLKERREDAAYRGRQRESQKRQRARYTEEKRHYINDRDRETKRRSMARRRETKPEEVRAYQRAWEEANRERVRELRKEWVRRNRERVREYQRVSKQQRRARKLTTQVEPIRTQDIIERDGQVCYLCDRRLRRDEVSLDHVIPLSRGGTHTPDNVKIACRSCNSRKGNKLLHELDWIDSGRVEHLLVQPNLARQLSR